MLWSFLYLSINVYILLRLYKYYLTIKNVDTPKPKQVLKIYVEKTASNAI